MYKEILKEWLWGHTYNNGNLEIIILPIKVFSDFFPLFVTKDYNCAKFQLSLSTEGTHGPLSPK